MTVAEQKKANANPTKAFFVRMITRDITLEDCIFDLIDNSIDGAWEQEGGQPMRLDNNIKLNRYKISVEIGNDGFSIYDNCGGISLDDAENYAFSFGRKETANIENYSIGVYGIGMKRAVFKIGSKIDIQSTYKSNGVLSSFQVPVDVDDWLKAGDSAWDFDINESDNLAEAGVRIDVTGLYEGTIQLFNSQRFIQDLRRAIARDYALHLDRDLRIEVNGKPIAGWPIKLRQSEKFVPMRQEFSERIEEEDVFIEVLAGMEEPPPNESDPDGDWDEGQNRSGWYVVCNGRIVLAADKTALTGWGMDNCPQWHPQYSGFIGLIIFSSKKAELLPLTTTKRSVDETSSVYRRNKPRMQDASRTWVDYTNKRKQTEREKVTQWENQAKAVPISEVVARTEIKFHLSPTRAREPEVNVNYRIARKRLVKLANAFDNINLPYREVGRRSFEYAYRDLVEE